MRKFRISGGTCGRFTVVSNAFLDGYMPGANGEFVKVYLCLLRLSAAGSDFCCSDIADALDCTEKDVVRAISYWEDQGLCRIERIGGEVAGILLTEPEEKNENASPDEESAGNLRLSGAEQAERFIEESGPDSLVISLDRAPEKAAAEQEESAEAISRASQDADKDYGAVPVPTASRIEELHGDSDIEQTLYVAATYLGRPLTRTDRNILLGIYDNLGFSCELLEYLVEYCAERGKKNIRYIEKVALGWKSQGITSPDAARKASESYNREYRDILRALGITGRTPTDAEINMMDGWTKEMGMPREVILEACRRTVLNTNSPTLAYANGIIKSWHDKNLKTLDAVKGEQKPARQGAKAAGGKGRRPDTGAFGEFQQRDYDFEDVTAKLLAASLKEG